MTLSADIQAAVLRDALLLDAYGVKPCVPHTDRLRDLAAAMNCQVLRNGTTEQGEMITAMIELDSAWSRCVEYRTASAQTDFEDALNSIQDAFSAMIVAAETDLANADKPIEVA